MCHFRLVSRSPTAWADAYCMARLMAGVWEGTPRLWTGGQDCWHHSSSTGFSWGTQDTQKTWTDPHDNIADRARKSRDACLGVLRLLASLCKHQLIVCWFTLDDCSLQWPWHDIVLWYSNTYCQLLIFQHAWAECWLIRILIWIKLAI